MIGLVYSTQAQIEFNQATKISSASSIVDSSSILDIESTNKGVLFPRMTLAQRDSINNPAVGLMIYNTTDDCLEIFFNILGWSSIFCDSVIIPSQTFSYTGGIQSFTVPAGINSITVDIYGAEGGPGNMGDAGLGGRVEATISVTPGQVLEVFVGGQGAPFGGPGGYNGGGDGATGSVSIYDGGGGGGASDIRIGDTTLSSRIVIAGGGGGGGTDGCTGNGVAGGDGGGLIGGNGQPGSGCNCNPSGAGGDQSAGGIAGTWACTGCNATDGSLGQGGNGNTSSSCGGTTGGAGGGGGYYGGGGGGLGAGGGGSSYTDPAVTGVTHTQGVRSGHGEITIGW